MEKKSSICILIGLVVCSSTLIVTGTAELTEKTSTMYKVETQWTPLEGGSPLTPQLPGDNGLMQRLRNRICDTIGICQGGVNLTIITGVLTYYGTNYYIGDVELHFGPTWFIESAESNVDYDHDGTKEHVYQELQGLVGTEITVEGHLQSSGWISVFIINGELYREPGQPIWSSQHQWIWQNRHRHRDP